MRENTLMVILFRCTLVMMIRLPIEPRKHVELMFPALEPIISYRQPTFTVKVGSYQSRLEAHKVFESLKQDFPLAVLIPERIEIIHE